MERINLRATKEMQERIKKAADKMGVRPGTIVMILLKQQLDLLDELEKIK